MRRDFALRSQRQCIRCRVVRVVMALDNIVLNVITSTGAMHDAFRQQFDLTLIPHSHFARDPVRNGNGSRSVER
jgi:hypothetical protein